MQCCSLSLCLCHRNLSWLWSCDRYFSLWWPAWVCDIGFTDLLSTDSITSFNKSSSILILKYSKHWVLNCNCKRFCQKSFGYSRWQNTIKNNNWFRSSISTFFCWLKDSYYGSEDKNCKQHACLTTASDTRNVMSHGARPCQHPEPIISTLQSPITRVWIRIKFSLTFSCLCKTESSY